MSRVLFVCSGNTCRSPMAARIAQRVFGSAHTVQSAGAEASSGMPAAPNAVAALKEMGLDLSGHSSMDVQEVDLSSFDLVVIFRPSRAESISIPNPVRVAYLDVEDPHEGTLDVYTTAAKLISKGVRRIYTDDAVLRASALDGPRGSHLEGIVNRAMKECEREVGEFVGRALRPVHETATLGQLKGVAEQFASSQNRSDLSPLLEALSSVNEVWKRVKHVKRQHKDPGYEDLIAALHEIGNVYKALDDLPQLAGDLAS
jgi:protein-tyrosine-phosphatase